MKKNPTRRKQHRDLFLRTGEEFDGVSRTRMSLYEDEEDYEDEISDQYEEVKEAFVEFINKAVENHEYDFDDSQYWDVFEDDLARGGDYFTKNLLGEIKGINWDNYEEEIEKYLEFYTELELFQKIRDLHLYTGGFYDNNSRNTHNEGIHEVHRMHLNEDSIYLEADGGWWLEGIIDELDMTKEYLEPYLNSRDFWEDVLESSNFSHLGEIDFYPITSDIQNRRGKSIQYKERMSSVSIRIPPPDNIYYQVTIDEESFYNALAEIDVPDVPIKPKQIIYQLEDGYGYVVELDARNLGDEGRRMGHCIGRDQYAEALIKGEIELYSLRTKSGKSKFTIEFDVESGSVNQVKGRANRIPGFTPELEREFETILRNYGHVTPGYLPKVTLIGAAEDELKQRVLPKFKVYEAYLVAEFLIKYIMWDDVETADIADWKEYIDLLLNIDDFQHAALLITHFNIPKPKMNPGYYHESHRRKYW